MAGRFRSSVLTALLLIVSGVAPSGDAARAQGERPRLNTNQATIEELMRETTLAIDDPLEVFAFVLQSLPERVTVYPTEGYYYFGFTYRGVNYSGNIRLDASDRDQGKVNFGYFEEMADWRGESPTRRSVASAISDPSSTSHCWARRRWRWSWRTRSTRQSTTSRRRVR